MNKSDLETNQKDIEKWLSSNDCYATVYSMHTHDEYLCSGYFVELKTYLGNDDLQKIMQLWKLYVIQQVEDGVLSSIPPMSAEEWITDQYSYFKEFFEPRSFKDSHKARALKILTEIRSSIRRKSGNFVKTLCDPGVYSNGKAVGIDKIDYIQSKISNCYDGIVVCDDWDDFMVFVKKNNEYTMFSWETSA